MIGRSLRSVCFFAIKVIPAAYLGLLPFLGAMFPAHNARCPCHGSDALVRLRFRQLTGVVWPRIERPATAAIPGQESKDAL